MATMRIGEIDVVPILDGAGLFDPSTAYTRFTTAPGRGGDEGDWAGHHQFLEPDGRLRLAYGAYLVRTGDRSVLVDAGMGRAAGAGDHIAAGGLLDDLAAHGVGVGDVTDVLFSHLHMDHIGWATTRGEVVFPNATYRCHRRDWDHFVGPDDAVTRKLAPAATRFATFDADVTIAPGLDVRLAPGHTPGSVIVVLSSGTARAVLIGDVAHCPVELVDDEWGALGDVDPALARRTREALARELEGADVPVSGAHFPGLSFGRLLTGQGRRGWVVA
jgi:glyoxylase-like metal-dependent hydrolase (beta-lactamase superfamily II)